MRRNDDAETLIEVRQLAATSIFNVSGKRKRRREQAKKNAAHGNDDDDDDAEFVDDGTVRGDQTVAIEFARRFSTPGLCYVVFDHVTNQLRVQQERPSQSYAIFHCAHVARMHRWM